MSDQRQLEQASGRIGAFAAAALVGGTLIYAGLASLFTIPALIAGAVAAIAGVLFGFAAAAMPAAKRAIASFTELLIFWTP